jgi:hypothetical protein
MSKYKIICNEGYGFSSWGEPHTRDELQEKFRDYAVMEWDEIPPKKAFTMSFIAEMWNVTFERVK